MSLVDYASSSDEEDNNNNLVEHDEKTVKIEDKKQAESGNTKRFAKFKHVE